MKFSFACFSPSVSASCSYDSSPATPIINYKRGSRIHQNSADAFTHDELKVATNNFRSSNKVGQGGFGTVYKGILPDGKLVAVKVLSVKSKQGDGEFMAEIASLSNVTHENIVHLQGGCVHDTSRFLVYDYMENNNLAQTLLGGEERRAKLVWKMRWEIALGVAGGLAHIHEKVKPHIVHRDIKSSNILLDLNFSPKISDFGLSKLFTSSITHLSTRVAGTLGYIAPEYAISGRLTRKSDIYSFGVLVLEIVSGRPAVDFNLELGEHYLVEKVWEMYKADKLVEMVDPALKADFSEEEAVLLLKVALLCVQEVCTLRPRMSMVIKIMNHHVNINNVEVLQPGLITDIMDVKIVQNGSKSYVVSSGTPQ